MQFMSAFAVYFIIWWITLFAILPIGLRTQADENEIVPGSVESAPARFRGGRVILLTTLVSGMIYGSWLVASTYFGISLDSLPKILPDFE
jgi:Predicted secreted protein